MLTPDVLDYYRRTAHLNHRAGYPLRRRAAIAQRVAAAGARTPAETDARMRYLVRGAFLADVYRADK